MLTLRGVTVKYDAVTAVDRVDLTVGDGEIVALLGPSGCGKSTLLRAIAGIEPIAAGRIEWDGVDLARIPVHRRGFGLMFQDGVLFPHRSVAGNVGYGLRNWGGRPREAGPRPSRGVGDGSESAAPQRAASESGARGRGGDGSRSAAVAERVAELLGMVGLAGYGDRRVTTLSGGEAQRVALARALAPHPRLLLLDEPLAALDTSLRATLLSDLDNVLRSTGTTAIFVTHDQGEAFAIADRIALMRAGRLVQIGTTAEVSTTPVDAQVAEFLGGAAATTAARVSPAVTGSAATGSESDDESEPIVVVAGAVIHHGKLLAAQRTSPPELAGKWELPGGKVEIGESDEAALARELVEELGLAVHVGASLGAGIALGPGPDGRRRELRVYQAKPADAETSYALLPTVHREVRWVGTGEIDSLDWVAADREVLGVVRSLIAPAPGEERVRRSANRETDIEAS